MSGLAALRVLLRRELQVELATREAAVAVGPVVLAGMLLGGLALGPEPERLRAAAPGLVWLLVLVAAVPLARGVAAAERDDDTWDLLRGLVRPGVLLVAKLGALWLALGAAWLVATLLAVVLLQASLGWVAVVAGALGTLGVAAATTVFGCLLAAGGRRAGLLAGLVLPAGLPALVAGVETAASGQLAPWGLLLGLYDVVLVVAAWAVFPALLEE